jgi:hypothetical protein
MSQKVNHGQTVDGQRSDLLDPRLEIHDTNKVATHGRPVSNNGHDETIEGDRIKVINAMKTNHCVTEHLCVCHRKQQKGNQRLSWEIEHID